MRIQQKIALLLIGVMMITMLGITGSKEVMAEGESNTFTLIVPADTMIFNMGWNDIGEVGVSNASIESNSKIRIRIDGGASGRTLTNYSGTGTIDYDITNSGSYSFGNGKYIEFTGNGTQAIGANVSYDSYEIDTTTYGTYEDTINFKATFIPAPTPEKYVKSNEYIANYILSVEDLGTPVNWTYNGKTYDVYNNFISFSSYSDWYDATGFVDTLNRFNYNGHNDWMLFESEAMAIAWKSNYKSLSRGDVNFLWINVSRNDSLAYLLQCKVDTPHTTFTQKNIADTSYGFVILRPTS